LFAELASLLYEGPWVAERFSAVQSLWERNPTAIHPVVRSIVERATGFSAMDTFKAEYRRAELSMLVDAVMEEVDAILVPTAPTIFTIDQVLADPLVLNSRLGIHTNFANFADMCALALPAGLRGDGLPAGITLLARAWHDKALARFGRRWQAFISDRPGYDRLGATARCYSAPQENIPAPPSNAVRVAVVGAHLRGMPLNHQLTSRGAAFVEATATASEYRLYALANSTPRKPGLVRVAPQEVGRSILVELWDIPAGNFGSFTAEVPSPLGIGNLQLIDGRTVKGFICEPFGIIGAEDITSFGGWAAYLGSL
jgi:allophanate hydrolase